MNLRELLIADPVVLQEQLIGKEIEILGGKALLLGIQQIEWEEEGQMAQAAKLSILYEQLPKEDDFWQDRHEAEDWEDETMTNRQFLLEALDAGAELSIRDIKGFRINGNLYEITAPETAGSVSLAQRAYDDVQLMKHFAGEDIIPDEWMKKDLELLALAGYYVEPGIFDAGWDVDIPNICIEMKLPDEQFPIGKIMELSIGHYDLPKEFSIKSRNGEDIPVKIHGLYLQDVWSLWEADASDAWDEEDMEEMEGYCGRDERLLEVEYSAPDNIQLNFFTKEYLDSPAFETDHSVSWGILSGEEPGKKLAAAAVVPEDFSGPVEMELMSYVKFGG